MIAPDAGKKGSFSGGFSPHRADLGGEETRQLARLGFPPTTLKGV